MGLAVPNEHGGESLWYQSALCEQCAPDADTILREQARPGRYLNLFRASNLVRYGAMPDDVYRAQHVRWETARYLVHGYQQKEVLEFVRDWQWSRGLYVYGESGTGKTHACLCIANHWMWDRQESVKYYVAPNILDMLSGYKSPSRPEVTARLTSPSLLIIDDLSMAEPAPKLASILSEVIETRDHEHRATLVTSQMSTTALFGLWRGKKHGPAEHVLTALESRMRAALEPVEFNWPDMRHTIDKEDTP